MEQMEADVEAGNPDADDYTVHLAKALLYKFILHAVGGKVSDPALESSSTQLDRGVPESYQEIPPGDSSQYPVQEPVRKLEADIQCTGEAEYVDDVGPAQNEGCAAFVYATVARCDLASVDTSAALAMPGVQAYVDASDVPGINNVAGAVADEDEVGNDEIFSSGRINFAGQPIGLIVADTFEHAR